MMGTEGVDELIIKRYGTLRLLLLRLCLPFLLQFVEKVNEALTL